MKRKTREGLDPQGGGHPIPQGEHPLGGLEISPITENLETFKWIKIECKWTQSRKKTDYESNIEEWGKPQIGSIKKK